MKSFRMVVSLCLLLLPNFGRSQVEALTQTESPTHEFTLGCDEGNGHIERLWLLSLPAKQAIGKPSLTGDFVGLPYHGGTAWNTRRNLVALTQGGIPYADTKLFRYSTRGLEELPFPDLHSLPSKWYRFAPSDADTKSKAGRIQRTYIVADRWVGRDTLLMIVSGTAVYGSELHKHYRVYDLKVRLRIDKRGRGKVIKVVDTPMEDL